MERGWIYSLKALDPNFVNGVDSFVKTLGHIASIGYKMMTMCTAHVLIAAIRNKFTTSSKSIVICWLGVLWQTIRFGKHREDGENIHHEASRHDTVQEIVHENITERVHERVEETVNELGNDTLADDEVSDDLDQMIRDGEPKFLDAKNLKKLEQMKKDAKTPLYQGSSVTKLEADMLLLELKSSNGMMKQ